MFKRQLKNFQTNQMLAWNLKCFELLSLKRYICICILFYPLWCIPHWSPWSFGHKCTCTSPWCWCSTASSFRSADTRSPLRTEKNTSIHQPLPHCSPVTFLTALQGCLSVWDFGWISDNCVQRLLISGLPVMLSDDDPEATADIPTTV